MFSASLRTLQRLHILLLVGSIMKTFGIMLILMLVRLQGLITPMARLHFTSACQTVPRLVSWATMVKSFRTTDRFLTQRCLKSILTW